MSAKTQTEIDFSNFLKGRKLSDNKAVVEMQIELFVIKLLQYEEWSIERPENPCISCTKAIKMLVDAYGESIIPKLIAKTEDHLEFRKLILGKYSNSINFALVYLDIQNVLEALKAYKL